MANAVGIPMYIGAALVSLAYYNVFNLPPSANLALGLFGGYLLVGGVVSKMVSRAQADASTINLLEDRSEEVGSGESDGA